MMHAGSFSTRSLRAIRRIINVHIYRGLVNKSFATTSPPLAQRFTLCAYGCKQSAHADAAALALCFGERRFARTVRPGASLSASATLRFCDNDGIIVRLQRHKRRRAGSRKSRASTPSRDFVWWCQSQIRRMGDEAPGGTD